MALICSLRSPSTIASSSSDGFAAEGAPTVLMMGSQPSSLMAAPPASCATAPSCVSLSKIVPGCQYKELSLLLTPLEQVCAICGIGSGHEGAREEAEATEGVMTVAVMGVAKEVAAVVEA